MVLKITIALLFFLTAFCAYQWGYQDGLGGEIERKILLRLSDRPSYALDLIDCINNERANKIGFGTMYPALNRLEKKSLITSEFERTKFPRRKIYRLIPMKSSLQKARENKSNLQ